MATLRPSLSRSALWVAVEAFSGSVISLVGLLIIASLIGPRALGLSAIVLGFVQTVNFFPDTLFHDAIIQRRRLTAGHLGSAFWSVCALSIVLSAVVAGSAHLVAKFYNQPDLSPLLVVMSVSSLPVAIASIQTARLRRAMRFRTLAIYMAISRATGTVAGLVLAVGGFGPWAIIGQYGLSVTILALALLITTRWRFIRNFSISHATEIGFFAFTRTAGHFIDISRGQLFFALLGRYLPLQALGELNLAFRLVDATTGVISSTLVRLYLPVFSRIQGNFGAVATAVRGASSITALVLMPLFTVLTLTGSDLVQVLASQQWQEMAGLVPLLCISGMATILVIPANTGMLAVGRPFLVSFESLGILAGLTIGILVIAPASGTQAVTCWTVTIIGGLLINFWVARYAMGLSISGRLSNLIPAIMLTAAVAAIAIAVKHVLISSATFFKVVSEIAAAGLVYLLFGMILIMLFHGLPGWTWRKRWNVRSYSKEVP